MTNLNDNSLVLSPNHDTPFGLYIFTKYHINDNFSREITLFLLQRTEIDHKLILK